MTVHLTVADVVRLHDGLFGGSDEQTPALTDVGKLDSALHRSEMHELYLPGATIHEQAAAVFEGIITAHAFVDGNKRTAVVAVFAFYLLNGYAFVNAPDGELLHLAVDVAAGYADASKASPMFEAWTVPLPSE